MSIVNVFPGGPSMTTAPTVAAPPAVHLLKLPTPFNQLITQCGLRGEDSKEADVITMTAEEATCVRCLRARVMELEGCR